MPDSYEGIVEKVVHGGDGLIRYQGQTVFIPNVIAGDTITYEITDKKRGVLRGKVLDVVNPSSQRVQAPCPVAETCGGCALQHMDLTAQAKLKTTWVTDAFQPFINSNTEVIPLQTFQNQGFAGRRRVRWFKAGNKLGFRQRFSHQVVHSQTCPAVTQPLNELRNHLETLNLPEGVQSIQAVELSNGIHIILESEQSNPDNFTPEHTANQQWWWRKLNSPSIKALHKPVLSLFDNIHMQPITQDTLDIEIGPNDFVQGHAAGNQTLVSQMLDWSQGSQRIVDLFSGCGNLSLPLAKALNAQVVGAELNPLSVQAANRNAKRLKLDATYETLDLFGKFSIEPFIGADTLILDPPRKGAKRICQTIHQFFPKQIIMVNCDVAAGARDAKALADTGFKLKSLRPLDLFPFAGHVEALSLWTP